MTGIEESLTYEIVRRALGDVGYSINVIVISTERFEETKNLIGGIAYAHKYGRVLQGAA